MIMIKNIKLIFVFFSLFSADCSFSMAGEIQRNTEENKEVNFCSNNEVNVFSCDLRTGEKISVCANDTPPTLKLAVKSKNKIELFTLNNAHQLSSNGPAWGISIIKTDDVISPVNLFLYIGNRESDEYSAIQFSGKTEICKPYTTFVDPKDTAKDGKRITIFNLNDLNITSSFFTSDDEEEQSDVENKVIKSWPRIR